MSSFFDAPTEDTSQARGKIRRPLGKNGKLAAAPLTRITASELDAKPVEQDEAPRAIDAAFLYDEVYDQLATEKAAARGAHALAGGSKFGASVAAAALQRQWDHEDMVVAKNRSERLAEIGDDELTSIDREMGIIVTESYRRRQQQRAAVRGDDEVLSFVPQNAVVPPAASIPDSLPHHDEKKVLKPERSPPVETTSDADVDATSDLAKQRVLDGATALARYEAARAEARQRRATECLPPSEVDALKKHYFAVKAAYDAALLRDA